MFHCEIEGCEQSGTPVSYGDRRVPFCLCPKHQRMLQTGDHYATIHQRWMRVSSRLARWTTADEGSLDQLDHLRDQMLSLDQELFDTIYKILDGIEERERKNAAPTS